jgi:hypothetical protein
MDAVGHQPSAPAERSPRTGTDSNRQPVPVPLCDVDDCPAERRWWARIEKKRRAMPEAAFDAYLDDALRRAVPGTVEWGVLRMFDRRRRFSPRSRA